MIQLLDLCKSFEDKEVLKHIDSTFEAGKTNLIIGQSGSGKTVLMKCIVGLLSPTSGQILYHGRNFVNMKKRERVLLRREMVSDESYKERRRRAQYCLDRVNLSDAGGKFPGEISGGMQKRVAIARAIALKPKYLFCDEPNSGLDPKTSLVIDELIHSITQEDGTTTIINTHDMNSVMGIGEHILYIYEGHREWEGTKDEVMNADNERLNSFIFASDLFRQIKDKQPQAAK